MEKKFIPAYLLTFVNVLGFSILMPILPFVVNSYGAPKWVFGLLITLYSAFQFIGAPLLGAMSDNKGRKPILLISQAGTLLSWIIFVIALTLPEYPLLGFALPLWIVALSRILDGITGGNASVTNAYVSDVTTPKEKSYIFGYLGGIAGIGMIIGPGLGGITAATSLGYMGTLLTSIVISTITLIAVFKWLKESHPEDKRTPKDKTNILEVLIIPLRVKRVNPSPFIKVLFTMKFFFSAMMGFYIGTMALFLVDLFDFNVKELGFFMFVIGLFLALNQAFVSKFFVKKIGAFKTLILGLILSALGLIAITLTKDLAWYIAYYYILNLGLSLCFPVFNSLISVNANPKKLGEIMGISEGINSFCMACFPVIAAIIYSAIGSDLYRYMVLLPVLGLVFAFIGIKKYGNKLS
ncbi:MFS family permease [Wenyingzhuangia heitensis]|uniref:MFS family permease n=1 Tax=Wenyingzhuangia heitensis TaxID=1487859 RepID=A0ABX0UCL0_9FLAO|nr:MFS transporter [Wenyingzhuangia heitensis]NIJ45550.1 MFS family permease [Wenyingzhuangia heitensis]